MHTPKSIPVKRGTINLNYSLSKRSMADFLQAISETQGAAFIDELPEDNHYLVSEGINDSEYSDSDQSSSDSDEL